MLASFEIDNLVGPVYTGGNILFSQQKNILFSPIANRVKQINLENNTSNTLPFEARSDVDMIIVSPDSKVMLIIDIQGYCLIVNLISQQIISHFNFKGKVKAAKFSPDGKFLAVAQGISFKIFEAPSIFRQFEALILYKKFNNSHSDDVVHLRWSPDSRFLVTAGKDLTVQLHNLFKIKDYNVITFGANKEALKQSFFSADMQYFYTLDRNSVLCVWKWVTDYVSDGYKNYQKYKANKSGKKLKIDENQEKNVQQQGEQEEEEEESVFQKNEKEFYSPFEKDVTKGRFILAKKHKFYQKQFSKVKSCEYHSGLQLLVLGYKHSNFTLHKIEEDRIADIQEITVSSNKISTITMNESGSWIGFGLKDVGQLMVWEWRSQQYIINQQCQGNDITACAYSNDGRVIATGGFDGKLRLWDTQSYLCFSVIEAHDSKITGIVFSSRAKTVITTSLDGTVKGFDLNKFKCFRIMKPDVPAQFTSVAIESSGELVAAGALDPYSIFVWNLQTGNLLEVIGGHTAGITTLKFSTNENVLFSGSLDKSIRVHDIFSRKTNTDVLEQNSEITAIAVRNDGKQISVATLKGEIYIWDVKNANIIANLDCRRDLQGGRLDEERQTSQTSSRNKHFRSLEYSSDGEYLLAGGNAKNLCLYDLRHRVLLKKFEFTNNRSLDGVLHKLNSKKLQNGVINEEGEVDTESDYEDRKDDSLPGAKQNNQLSKRRVKQAAECREIKFSPADDSFSVATSEGLIVYSKSKKIMFTPYELDSDLSLQSVQNAMDEKNYSQALVMALKINNQKLLTQVYLGIPQQHVFSCVKHIDTKFLNNFVNFISDLINENDKIECHLIWLESILFEHSEFFQLLDMHSLGNLKGLLKKLGSKFEHTSKITSQNLYQIDYIVANMKLNHKKQQEQEQQNLELQQQEQVQQQLQE